MATEVKMPQLGETVVEGTITKWFKQEGEEVSADELLVEVSTDKVDSEVPSSARGFSRRSSSRRGRRSPSERRSRSSVRPAKKPRTTAAESKKRLPTTVEARGSGRRSDESQKKAIDGERRSRREMSKSSRLLKARPRRRRLPQRNSPPRRVATSRPPKRRSGAARGRGRALRRHLQARHHLSAGAPARRRARCGSEPGRGNGDRWSDPQAGRPQVRRGQAEPAPKPAAGRAGSRSEGEGSRAEAAAFNPGAACSCRRSRRARSLDEHPAPHGRAHGGRAPRDGACLERGRGRLDEHRQACGPRPRRSSRR